MELSLKSVALTVVFVTVITWAWRVLNWVWLRPKKLEKYLRQQGLSGNSYRCLHGDLKETSIMLKEAKSRPINLDDDIAIRVMPFLHKLLKDYGKNCFIWVGPTPRVNITNADQMKEILTKFNDFHKVTFNPLFKLVAVGLASHNGEKWAKHRKLTNPAFYQEKLKLMVPAFYQSCSEMISKWENLVSKDGFCELDVWPYLTNLTADVISRTAFGSSYEEGREIFQLQTELLDLTTQVLRSVYIPGWRFLPTKRNKRIKEIRKKIQALLMGIIEKREKAMKAGEAAKDDLLGLLLASNFRATEEHGNNKNEGFSAKDVMEECKIFYLAGQETTASLLVWTMALLSKHQDWQARAREEVLQLFGNNKKPDFDGLNRLKTVQMILYEVLRLYPPTVMLIRNVRQETKFRNLSLPAGVEINLPLLQIHRDHELWGDDATEFKPERFSEGISKATKNQLSFFPFGWGPRICIGQNFSLIEAKMALALILRNFSFKLSPSYVHSPKVVATLEPEYGTHLILQKL